MKLPGRPSPRNTGNRIRIMSGDAATLKNLSADEFALLGTESIAYVKRVTGPEGVRFHIITADGQVVAEAEDYDSARLALDHFDLEPVTLQ